MKSLCLFSHFDKDDRIADYVLEYLKGLNKVVDKIVFVSTAALSDVELNKVVNYTDTRIVRENIGYDFMSWQVGLHSVEDYISYDEIMIANDSCYAPLFPFEEMFSKMRSLDCDFWGNTESQEISPHMQSYFVVFNKQVVTSEVFSDFWNNIYVEKNKKDIILKYEIGLSQKLIASGFSYRDYFSFEKRKHSIWDFKELILMNLKKPSKLFSLLFKVKKIINVLITGKGINPSIFLYEATLDRRSPLLKVQLIRENLLEKASREEYYSDINKKSDYDTGFIEEHLSRK